MIGRWNFEYETFKSITLGKGLVSQIVLTKTLENRYAIPNITLGIIGKTGNTHFILAKPLPYQRNRINQTRNNGNLH